MADRPARKRRTIGVLLTPYPDGRAVTAEVVWGLMPWIGPRTVAGSPENALADLEEQLARFGYDKANLAIFDDLEEAHREKRRRESASRLLDNSFDCYNRQALLNALDDGSSTGEEATAGEVLAAFDRVAAVLERIAAGGYDSRYLVPDFDCHATGTWLYVPKHDPRYKNARIGGHVDDDTPVRRPVDQQGGRTTDQRTSHRPR